MTEVERVAAGLTLGEQDWLLGALWHIPKHVADTMIEKGLLTRKHTTTPNSMGYVLRRTKSGLAVRAHLEGKAHD